MKKIGFLIIVSLAVFATGTSFLDRLLTDHGITIVSKADVDTTNMQEVLDQDIISGDEVSAEDLNIKLKAMDLKITSLTNSSLYDVGDVRQSMLTISEFTQRNGDCWKQFDGIEDVSDTEYGAIIRTRNANPTMTVILPNADGRFLRNQGGNAAPLGQTQEHALQDHSHENEIGNPGGDHRYSASGVSGSSWNITNTRGVYVDGANPPLVNADETRPSNMTVNLFIKVSSSCN